MKRSEHGLPIVSRLRAVGNDALLLRRCHDCNQPIGARDRFCPRCGARQPREPR